MASGQHQLNEALHLKATGWAFLDTWHKILLGKDMFRHCSFLVYLICLVGGSSEVSRSQTRYVNSCWSSLRFLHVL
jgi:hypothetical protein